MNRTIHEPTKSKRILLVNRGSLNRNTSATIFFKKIIEYFDDESLVVFSLGVKDKNKPTWLFNKKYYVTNQSYLESNKYIRKTLKSFFPRFYYRSFFSINGVKLNKLLNVVIQEKIDKLWIYPDFYVTNYATRVIKDLNIPFHISILDDPFDNVFTQNAIPFFYDTFKYLLVNATSYDVVSTEMLHYFNNKQFNISNAIVTWAGFVKNRNEPVTPVNDIIRNICMMGNPWAKDTIIQFLTAIEHINITQNSKIHLELYASYCPKEFRKFTCFKYGGFLTEKDSYSILASYDLLYVPMSFKEKERTKSNISFPSKVTSYLGSGVPIFAHAPKDSALDNFISSNNVGFSFNFSSPMEIEKYMMTTVMKQTNRIKVSEAANGLSKSTFALGNNVEKWIEVIKS